VELGLDLAAFTALGALGALHCAGMCGPFALALGASSRGKRASSAAHAALYVVGKALAYAMLGALVASAAGALASSVASQPAWLATVRSSLAWLAGLASIAFGAAALGVRVPWLRVEAPLAWIRTAFAAARSLGGASHSFALGVANGLLPCGLSWAAFALCATLDPARAAVGAFAFGLATAPVLVAIALGARAIPAGWRERGLRWSAPLVIAFGVLTIARGGIPGGERALPSCCDPGVAHTTPNAELTTK
jgi:sulfite exporter TauE/SafE